MRTGVPQVPLDFFEFDTQKTLVNLEDGRDNNVDREIFFHEGIIEGEGLFDVEAVVVPIQNHKRNRKG